MPDAVTLSAEINYSTAGKDPYKPYFGGSVDIVWAIRTGEVAVFVSPTESQDPTINSATGFPQDAPALSWGREALKSKVPVDLPFMVPNVFVGMAPGVAWSDDGFRNGLVKEYRGTFHHVGGSFGTGAGAGINVYMSADPETGAPAILSPKDGVYGVQVPIGVSVQPGYEAHAYASYSRPMMIGNDPLSVDLY
jgi:hypothetical protein